MGSLQTRNFYCATNWEVALTGVWQTFDASMPDVGVSSWERHGKRTGRRVYAAPDPDGDRRPVHRPTTTNHGEAVAA